MADFVNRLRHFFAGMGSALEVIPPPMPPLTGTAALRQSDYDAMQNDWQAVGGFLIEAIEAGSNGTEEAETSVT